MTREEFWQIIDQARKGTEDVEQIAGTLQSLLEKRNPAEVLSFLEHQARLMEESYSWKLWGAAYLINGGCSDDGFDYFRGWLIAQGRDVFETAVADPDSLADVPAVRGALAGGDELECEAMLGAAWDAYSAAVDDELPDAGKTALPELAPMWDFDDEDAMREHLPRLAALAYDAD